MSFNLKNRNCFTLVEILVSVAIFIILSTVVIANFRSAGSKNILDQAADQVITSFRQAQTSTLAGVTVAAVSPAYGLYLTTQAAPLNNQLTIFADLDSDKIFDAGAEESSINCSVCGVFSLPNNIQVSALSPISGSGLTTIFSATNTSDLYFNGILAVVNGVITLQNVSTGDNITLTIYHTAGQISR